MAVTLDNILGERAFVTIGDPTKSYAAHEAVLLAGGHQSIYSEDTSQGTLGGSAAAASVGGLPPCKTPAQLYAGRWVRVNSFKGMFEATPHPSSLTGRSASSVVNSW